MPIPALLVFFIILGVLIFVHELGHFVVARRNGIRASEFGFGFPPRIFGIQLLRGRKIQKVREIEEIRVEKTDIKSGDEEIVQETITEKIHTVEKPLPIRKWRIIWGRHDGDDENEQKDWEEIDQYEYKRGTIYSLNWIPIGGFVRIKGEDGGHKNDPDSFSTKSAWTRTKVLAAGVAMNFVLAWVVISAGLMIGDPQPAVIVGENSGNAVIQIEGVAENSPAQNMGLRAGDEIVKKQVALSGEEIVFKSADDVQSYIGSNKGKEMALTVKRGNNTLTLKGTPRVDVPQGQGALGIQFSENVFVRYPWYKAFWLGLRLTGELTLAIIVAIFEILKNLVLGHGTAGAELAGPVKIYDITKQATEMGLIYVLHLATLLSINLGIINILPIPALDGGRILFIIIEKIKGSQVNQKVEQAFHTTFFFILILLMAVISVREVYEMIAKKFS